MADAPAPAPVDLSRFNPFDPKIQQCPFPHYRAMQDQGGVFPVAGTDLFMITKHELVTPILRNTTLFSNNFGSAGEPAKGDVVDRIKAVLATDDADRRPAGPHPIPRHGRHLLHAPQNG
jgi:cytochrome P450